MLHSAWFHNRQAEFYLLDCGMTAATVDTLTAYAAGPTFDAAKIHRVGLEIRTERGSLALGFDIPHNNAPTDFRPKGLVPTLESRDGL